MEDSGQYQLMRRFTLLAFAVALLCCAGFEGIAQGADGPVISAFSGLVQRRTVAGNEWEKVEKAPLALSFEDMVRTRHDSTAVISFIEDSRIELKENTVFTVNKSLADRFGGDIDVGLLKAIIKRLGGRRFILHTPAVVVSVRGTEFQVEVLKGGRTIVDLYRGKLDLEDRKGKKLELKPNQRIEADTDEGMGKPEEITGGKDERPGDRIGQVSPSEMEQGARQTVKDLVAAYESKNRSAFMKLLSDNFKGDIASLEDAIRGDFKTYDTLSLELGLDKPEIHGKHITAGLFFDLLTTDKVGAKSKFRGTSKFAFRWEKGRALISQMDAPLVFGRKPEADLEAAARESLKALTQHYSDKKRRAFLGLVSNEFAGNISILEDALKKDFRDYRTIEFKESIDKVSVTGDKISVQFHYQLAIVNDAGNSGKYNGATEYLFKWEDGKAKLFKMSAPFIFGNSLLASANPMGGSQGTDTTTQIDYGDGTIKGSPGAAQGVFAGTWRNLSGEVCVATSGCALGTQYPYSNYYVLYVTQTGDTFSATSVNVSNPSDTESFSGTVSGNTATAVTNPGTGDCGGTPWDTSITDVFTISGDTAIRRGTQQACLACTVPPPPGGVCDRTCELTFVRD